MSWEFDFLEIDEEFLDDLLKNEEDEKDETVSKYDEDNEDDEGTDYNDTESFDEYQQKFEYSKNQQKVEYLEIKDKRESETYKIEKKHNELESPEERGHKWGCGCPGCQRFMNTFPDLNPSLLQKDVKGKTIKPVEKDRSAYPCGGRLHAEYHKMLKFTIGSEMDIGYSLGMRKKDVMGSLAF